MKKLVIPTLSVMLLISMVLAVLFFRAYYMLKNGQVQAEQTLGIQGKAMKDMQLDEFSMAILNTQNDWASRLIEGMSREFVRNMLEYPDNPEFRNQHKFCGEVNSKNSRGAYTGFQKFMAPEKDTVIFERDPLIPTGGFEKIWNKFCT